MQQQPQVNFAPPPLSPSTGYQENLQQGQGKFIHPGQNGGVFAAPLLHGQPPSPPVVVQGVPGQAPQVGSKLDPIELVNILLRFVAVLMTFIATVIVGATKYVHAVEKEYYDRKNYETKTRWIYTTYKLSSLSPIKYFLAANSIVLFYSVATLVISVSSMLTKNKQGNDTLRNKLIMLFVGGDLAMVLFLFSAVASAAASKNTFNTKSDFTSVNGVLCDLIKDGFCDKWNAGIVMSMFGAVAYLLLELLSVFTLTKMNNNN